MSMVPHDEPPHEPRFAAMLLQDEPSRGPPGVEACVGSRRAGATTWFVALGGTASGVVGAGERGASPGVSRKGAEDVVLRIENGRAVIAGDTLVDFGQGLEIPPEWLPDRVTAKQVAGGLRPLLERPVEPVLATHGGPTERAALERALA